MPLNTRDSDEDFAEKCAVNSAFELLEQEYLSAQTGKERLRIIALLEGYPAYNKRRLNQLYLKREEVIKPESGNPDITAA